MSDFKISGSNRPQRTNTSSVTDSTSIPSSPNSSKTPIAGFGNMSKMQQLLFASFPQLAQPEIDQKMLIDILKKLEVDLFQSQLLGESEVVKTNNDKVQDLTKINQKKAADMLKKIGKKKTTSLVGKIFGWIGAALGVILGGILAVVTFGAGSVLAGTLIAMSVALAVALIIMSATGGMEKMVSALAKPISKALQHFGMSKKKADKVSQIISQVIVSVVIIAVQIVLAVASGGASTANFASEMANKVASIAMKIANFSLAAVAIAGGAANVASGVYNYQALEDKADSEENKAILKKIQTLIDNEEDMIKEIMEHLLAVQKNMGQLIKDENENRGKLADIDASSAAV